MIFFCPGLTKAHRRGAVCHPKRRDGGGGEFSSCCRCEIQGFRASASKAKSSVLSQLSGLENVVFNDFIDEEFDSEDVSEQRASASLSDSVPIESEEERAARETDEMAALDASGIMSQTQM
jgi:hypothetical protein